MLLFFIQFCLRLLRDAHSEEHCIYGGFLTDADGLAVDEDDHEGDLLRVGVFDGVDSHVLYLPFIFIGVRTPFA